MEQERFSLIQPLSNSLSGANVASHSKGYFGNLLRQIWSTLAAYMALLKLRSATLNALSALMGIFLAAGANIPWDRAFVLLVSVWLVAAGCGALNSYIDRDIDQIMYRTSRRPLPLGLIEPAEKALYVGIFLVALGLLISVVWLNLLVTLFISSGAAIYIFVYTMWLKRRTSWSVVIGGLAGTCALLAGAVSVTTNLSLLPFLFGLFVFLWTLGHFWSLSIRIKDDNKRANIPSIATIHGEKTTSKWTALSNIVLLPVSIIPYALGMLGEVYLSISLIIGLIVLATSIKLYFAPTTERAWTVFKLSSLYLTSVYVAVAVDILLL